MGITKYPSFRAKVLVAFVLLSMLSTGCRGSISSQISNTFSKVCTGGSVPEAAEFLGGLSGPVPTLILNAQGGPYNSAVDLGAGWDPKSISEVQLVVCVGDETSLSAYCPDGSEIIGLAGRKVKVFEAKTGMRIHESDIVYRYHCGNGGSDYYDSDSIEAIRARLEKNLAAGNVHRYIPVTSFIPSIAIIKDPAGYFTYFHIPAHGFTDGQELMYYDSSIGIEPDLYPLISNHTYYAKWVDKDTFQFVNQIGGDPIRFDSFGSLKEYVAQHSLKPIQ